jgi:hypothetical protein
MQYEHADDVDVYNEDMYKNLQHLGSEIVNS